MSNQLRRLRATITVVVALTAVMALSVSAAFAQYPPDEDFGVVCAPAEPQPGDTVTCEVAGAEGGEQLDATATAEVAGVIYEDSFPADENGRASFSFSTEGLQEGESVSVTVRGAQSGETGDAVEVDEDADEDGEPVAAGPDAGAADDGLPVTGSQVLMLSVVGLALVGGGLLALRKRGSVA